MGGIDWDDYHFLKEHGVFELNLKIQEQTYENILSAMKRDESDVSLTAYMRGLFDDTWEPSYVVSNSTKEFPGYLEQFDGLENTVAIRFFTSNTPIDHHDITRGLSGDEDIRMMSAATSFYLESRFGSLSVEDWDWTSEDEDSIRSLRDLDPITFFSDEPFLQWVLHCIFVYDLSLSYRGCTKGID